MPDFAEKIVVDPQAHSVTVDGVEVPWVIRDPPEVTLAARDDVPSLTIEILCKDIEVRPAHE